MSSYTVTKPGKACKEYPNRRARLAETLTTEFGRGLDASNLRYVRLFYQILAQQHIREMKWKRCA